MESTQRHVGWLAAADVQCYLPAVDAQPGGAAEGQYMGRRVTVQSMPSSDAPAVLEAHLLKLQLLSSTNDSVAKLIGFYRSEGHKEVCAVYERPAGAVPLREHLQDRTSDLSWKERAKIASEVADAAQSIEDNACCAPVIDSGSVFIDKGNKRIQISGVVSTDQGKETHTTAELGRLLVELITREPLPPAAPDSDSIVVFPTPALESPRSSSLSVPTASRNRRFSGSFAGFTATPSSESSGVHLSPRDSGRSSAFDLSSSGAIPRRDAVTRERRWETVQVKAFTAWLNSYLGRRDLKIIDLQTDLHDGTLLNHFLEIVNSTKMRRWTAKPNSKITMLENLSIGLAFIQKDMGVKLVGIGPEDIYNGLLKLILGLVWSLFKGLQMRRLATDGSMEEELTKWVREHTKSLGVAPSNFKDGHQYDFKDGQVFAALISQFDPTLLDFEAVKGKAPEELLPLVFELAEKYMGVPRLLEPSELLGDDPDERAIQLYVSLLFDAFSLRKETIEFEAVAEVSPANEPSSIALAPIHIPADCPPAFLELAKQCCRARPDERPSLTDIRNRLRGVMADIAAQQQPPLTIRVPESPRGAHAVDKINGDGLVRLRTLLLEREAEIDQLKLKLAGKSGEADANEKSEGDDGLGSHTREYAAASLEEEEEGRKANEERRKEMESIVERLREAEVRLEEREEEIAWMKSQYQSETEGLKECNRELDETAEREQKLIAENDRLEKIIDEQEQQIMDSKRVKEEEDQVARLQAEAIEKALTDQKREFDRQVKELEHRAKEGEEEVARLKEEAVEQREKLARALEEKLRESEQHAELIADSLDLQTRLKESEKEKEAVIEQLKRRLSETEQEKSEEVEKAKAEAREMIEKMKDDTEEVEAKLRKCKQENQESRRELEEARGRAGNEEAGRHNELEDELDKALERAQALQREKDELEEIARREREAAEELLKKREHEFERERDQLVARMNQHEVGLACEAKERMEAEMRRAREEMSEALERLGQEREKEKRDLEHELLSERERLTEKTKEWERRGEQRDQEIEQKANEAEEALSNWKQTIEEVEGREKEVRAEKDELEKKLKERETLLKETQNLVEDQLRTIKAKERKEADDDEREVRRLRGQRDEAMAQRDEVTKERVRLEEELSSVRNRQRHLEAKQDEYEQERSRWEQRLSEAIAEGQKRDEKTEGQWEERLKERESELEAEKQRSAVEREKKQSDAKKNEEAEEEGRKRKEEMREAMKRAEQLEEDNQRLQESLAEWRREAEEARKEADEQRLKKSEAEVTGLWEKNEAERAMEREEWEEEKRSLMEQMVRMSKEGEDRETELRAAKAELQRERGLKNEQEQREKDDDENREDNSLDDSQRATERMERENRETTEAAKNEAEAKKERKRERRKAKKEDMMSEIELLKREARGQAADSEERLSRLTDELEQRADAEDRERLARRQLEERVGQLQVELDQAKRTAAERKAEAKVEAKEAVEYERRAAEERAKLEGRLRETAAEIEELKRQTEDYRRLTNDQTTTKGKERQRAENKTQSESEDVEVETAKEEERARMAKLESELDRIQKERDHQNAVNEALMRRLQDLEEEHEKEARQPAAINTSQAEREDGDVLAKLRRDLKEMRAISRQLHDRPRQSENGFIGNSKQHDDDNQENSNENRSTAQCLIEDDDRFAVGPADRTHLFRRTERRRTGVAQACLPGMWAGLLAALLLLLLLLQRVDFVKEWWVPT